MNALVILAAAFGLACANPIGILQNHPPADVVGATQNFIREYNRLAKLAADAPDIEVYHDDGTPLNQKLTSSPNAISSPNRPQVQVVNPLQGLDIFSFAANLGTNSQFQPNQFQSFSSAGNRPTAPAQRTQTRLVQSVASRNISPIQPSAVNKWTGPLAHSIPAGVNGPPQQVGDTPEVAAAKNAHFSILSAAFQRAAEEAARNPPQEQRF